MKNIRKTRKTMNDILQNGKNNNKNKIILSKDMDM